MHSITFLVVSPVMAAVAGLSVGVSVQYYIRWREEVRPPIAVFLASALVVFFAPHSAAVAIVTSLAAGVGGALGYALDTRRSRSPTH